MANVKMSVRIARDQAFACMESEGYAARSARAPAFANMAEFVRSAICAAALCFVCTIKGKATAFNARGFLFARMADEKGQNAKNACWQMFFPNRAVLFLSTCNPVNSKN
jgi:hypothetical protein